MSALSELTDAVVGMSASVDAAIAKLGEVPADNSAELAALTGQILDAKGRLDAAVAGTTPP